MKLTKERLILLATSLTIMLVILFAGNESALSKVSLGSLFTVLIWYRTGENISRWMAVAVLWLGLLLLSVVHGFLQQ